MIIIMYFHSLLMPMINLTIIMSFYSLATGTECIAMALASKNKYLGPFFLQY